MKAKKYLSKDEINNIGEDFCNMFYSKDENGYYETIWIESEKQKFLRLQGENIEDKIKDLQYQIDYLKRKLEDLTDQYNLEDETFTTIK